MKASEKQIGGGHYKTFKIQPYEFFIKNQIPFHKADIIKRILRYDQPTGKGLEDLEKIKHEVDLILEWDNFRNYSGYAKNPNLYEFMITNCIKRNDKYSIMIFILSYDAPWGEQGKDLQKIKTFVDEIIKTEYSES